MIFYFSATGNSKWVASLLSERLQLPMYDFTDGQVTAEFIQERTPAECTVFVVPVHGWEAPRLMANFLRFLQEKRFHTNYIYVVFTCGDDCGFAHKKIEKLISPLSDHPLIAYSVQMPNTYILLPGFDVDDEKIQEKKLSAAPKRVNQIAAAIQQHQYVPELYEAGRFAWVKSNILNPLFVKFIKKEMKFHVTDACNGCGKCRQICPTKTIQLDAHRHPVWNNTCEQCLACIHSCPQQAIQWGNATQRKGRYLNPFTHQKR